MGNASIYKKKRGKEILTEEPVLGRKPKSVMFHPLKTVQWSITCLWEVTEFSSVKVIGELESCFSELMKTGRGD